MLLVPHLSFPGRCEAAFHFYETCLGGKVTYLLRYKDSPLANQVPAEFREKIIHATLTLGDQRFTGADMSPDQFRQPQGFSLTLNLDSPDQADRLFQNLAENGHIVVPLQETFWAARFGMLVDQFGTPWMINCGNAA